MVVNYSRYDVIMLRILKFSLGLYSFIFYRDLLMLNNNTKSLLLWKGINYFPKNFFFFNNTYVSLTKTIFGFLNEYALFRSLLIKNFTHYSVIDKSVNANTLLTKETIYPLLRKFKNKNKKKYKILYFNEIIELFFISFKVKVISGVVSWIRSYLEKSHFKKHKILISFIFYLLSLLIWKNKLTIKVLGIKCFFKGKLGRGGSVRKSKSILTLGKISYSTKSIRLIQKKSIIWTKSGSVGFGLELFYNC